MNARLLLVEDDHDLARGILFNLKRERYDVEHAADAAGAERLLLEQRFDLVLLDLNLPDRDGLDLLKDLRDRGARVPVICLTARGQETDVVMGLELGADDYVKKPFGVAELLARIDAMLRRSGPAGKNELELLGVTIDLDARLARHADREEELTPIEIDLLKYLHERKGTSVDRRELLKSLWGLSSRCTTRTLDNHVARLRKKIEVDPSRPRVLLTVHGVGYRLESGGTKS